MPSPLRTRTELEVSVALQSFADKVKDALIKVSVRIAFQNLICRTLVHHTSLPNGTVHTKYRPHYPGLLHIQNCPQQYKLPLKRSACSDIHWIFSFFFPRFPPFHFAKFKAKIITEDFTVIENGNLDLKRAYRSKGREGISLSVCQSSDGALLDEKLHFHAATALFSVTLAPWAEIDRPNKLVIVCFTVVQYLVGEQRTGPASAAPTFSPLKTDVAKTGKKIGTNYNAIATAAPDHADAAAAAPADEGDAAAPVAGAAAAEGVVAAAVVDDPVAVAGAAAAEGVVAAAVVDDPVVVAAVASAAAAPSVVAAAASVVHDPVVVTAVATAAEDDAAAAAEGAVAAQVVDAAAAAFVDEASAPAAKGDAAAPAVDAAAAPVVNGADAELAAKFVLVERAYLAAKAEIEAGRDAANTEKKPEATVDLSFATTTPNPKAKGAGAAESTTAKKDAPDDGRPPPRKLKRKLYQGLSTDEETDEEERAPNAQRAAERAEKAKKNPLLSDSEEESEQSDPRGAIDAVAKVAEQPEAEEEEKPVVSQQSICIGLNNVSPSSFAKHQALIFECAEKAEQNQITIRGDRSKNRLIREMQTYAEQGYPKMRAYFVFNAARAWKRNQKRRLNGNVGIHRTGGRVGLSKLAALTKGPRAGQN